MGRFALVEEVPVCHSFSHGLQFLSTYFIMLGTIWAFPPPPPALHQGIRTHNSIVTAIY